MRELRVGNYELRVACSYGVNYDLAITNYEWYAATGSIRNYELDNYEWHAATGSIRNGAIINSFSYGFVPRKAA